MAQDGITVSVPGASDLIKELREFKEDVRRRVVRKVIKDVGDFILRRLRANAPVFTGKLRFNLSAVTRWKDRAGVMQTKVRVATQGKADNTRNAFYWRFVEFGYRLRRGSDRGGGSDSVTGQKFVERTQREVQEPVARMMFRELERALAKRRRKGGGR
jgi:HK97 gp10 family phage protein